MLETLGDIWEHAGRGAVIVITSNGSLTRDGRAVIGRGVAKQAALCFPGLQRNWATGYLLANRYIIKNIRIEFVSLYRPVT